MKKVLCIMVIIILLLISVLLGMHLQVQLTKPQEKPRNDKFIVGGEQLEIEQLAEMWEGERETLQSKQNRAAYISIPGFKELVLKADEVKQQVNFYNPESNDVLFEMEFSIDDISLWKSGYIEPGSCYYEIILNEPINAGEYDGCLVINCVTKYGEPMNGANIFFNVIVQ